MLRHIVYLKDVLILLFNILFSQVTYLHADPSFSPLGLWPSCSGSTHLASLRPRCIFRPRPSNVDDPQSIVTFFALKPIYSWGYLCQTPKVKGLY